MTMVYITFALGAFMIGLSKGGLGGALGSLVTAILVLVVPAPVAVGLSLPMLIFGDVFALYAHWNRWDMEILKATMPGTIAGVILGSMVLGSLSPITLQHGLGIAALLYIVYKIWERRSGKDWLSRPGPLAGPLFGSMTGFVSALANQGGPIYTIYLLTLRITPRVFIGTSALYFAILNLIKLPAYLGNRILTLESLFFLVWVVPLIPFGVWSGILLNKVIDKPTFEKIILVLLAITGVLLLLK